MEKTLFQTSLFSRRREPDVGHRVETYETLLPKRSTENWCYSKMLPPLPACPPFANAHPSTFSELPDTIHTVIAPLPPSPLARYYFLSQIRFMVREVVRGQQQLELASAAASTPTGPTRISDGRSSSSLLCPPSPSGLPAEGAVKRLTDSSYEPLDGVSPAGSTPPLGAATGRGGSLDATLVEGAGLRPGTRGYFGSGGGGGVDGVQDTESGQSGHHSPRSYGPRGGGDQTHPQEQQQLLENHHHKSGGGGGATGGRGNADTGGPTRPCLSPTTVNSGGRPQALAPRLDLNLAPSDAVGQARGGGGGEESERGRFDATRGSRPQSAAVEAAHGTAGGGTRSLPRPRSAPQISPTSMHLLATHNSFGASPGMPSSGGYSFADTTPGATLGAIAKGSGLKGASLAGTLAAYSTRPGGELDVFAAARDGQVGVGRVPTGIRVSNAPCAPHSSKNVGLPVGLCTRIGGIVLQRVAERTYQED